MIDLLHKIIISTHFFYLSGKKGDEKDFRKDDKKYERKSFEF